ncbi:MAG: thioredoxin [Bacteroidetes bacterium]|nr:thioredoxin [Bacteroidota bacterium]
MKNSKSIFLSMLSILIFIGLNSYAQNLSPVDFQKKMNELPKAPVVDVRTPNEFNQSHIKNAINININDNNFTNLINKLDRNKAVFVYCLSGSRSAYAAKLMQSKGFKVIYDLSGGMMKWRAAALPETTSTTAAKDEMSQSQFKSLLNKDKLVLVDFFAEWCGPCKVMAPVLKEIADEMRDKVKVIKIDVEQNKEIAATYKIKSVPTIMILKNTKVLYKKTGAHSKAQLIELLKENL